MNSPKLTLTKNTTKNKYMTKIENTPPPFPLKLFKSRHFCLFKDETLTTKLFVFVIQKRTIRIKVTHSVTWYTFPSGTPEVIVRTADVR